MTRYVFRMPDLGEGTVEAEVVAWHVKVGDVVTEDQVMAEVMTDKAAVEVPAPVSGRVVAIHGHAGDMIRVGAELVVFETESSEDLAPTAAAVEPVAASPAATSVAAPSASLARHDDLPTAGPVAAAASPPVSPMPVEAGEAKRV